MGEQVVHPICSSNHVNAFSRAMLPIAVCYTVVLYQNEPNNVPGVYCLYMLIVKKQYLERLIAQIESCIKLTSML